MVFSIMKGLILRGSLFSFGLTIFLYIFRAKMKNRGSAQKIRGFFHENTWCLFWICVATMSSLASHAVATYTYGASREACKAHGSTY